VPAWLKDPRFWAYCALATAAIWANYKVWDTSQDFQNEVNGRRDEACRGYELGHKQEIDDLKRSFDLFEHPTPAIKDFIDSFIQDPRILAQLADEIDAAQEDQDERGVYVPSYCDEEGYGLAEPDPAVPKTPPELEKNIEKLRRAAGAPATPSP
jgi:hypothetical protein